MICIGTYDVFKDTEMLVEGNNDDNWPKRCETRRLGLQVSFFFAFIVFSVYLTMEIGTTDALKVRRGPVGGNDNDNGPKRRKRRVVWALGEFFIYFLHFFFFFFLYLTIYIGTTISLKVRYGSTQATTATTGPR